MWAEMRERLVDGQKHLAEVVEVIPCAANDACRLVDRVCRGNRIRQEPFVAVDGESGRSRYWEL